MLLESFEGPRHYLPRPRRGLGIVPNAHLERSFESPPREHALSPFLLECGSPRNGHIQENHSIYGVFLEYCRLRKKPALSRVHFGHQLSAAGIPSVLVGTRRKRARKDWVFRITVGGAA